MENKLLDRVSKSLSVELPEQDSLDDYLDEILKAVRPLSEDLREQKFYLNKSWLELRDDEHFHDAVLHFFHEGGEYLHSVNGDVSSGSWRFLDSSNKLMINDELFDLAFLDPEFFILSKHGDQQRLKKAKYFVLVFEPIGRKLEWRDAMEKLFNKYRNSNSFYITLAIIILLIIAIVALMSF
ncbi:MAG TPA: hypothetical protein PKA00_18045 [Saprospiraceae bacterium]|nr:hypothetical protein [Saprospiraceae bacterium]HMQ84820.1 hypothetical protein [Saprospiraceae bacterium]